MCVGLESAKSEVAVIEALDRASTRLHSQLESYNQGVAEDTAGYDQFTEWAKLWRGYPIDGSGPFTSTDLDIPLEQHSHDSAPSFDRLLSSFPAELDEFSLVPWLSIGSFGFGILTDIMGRQWAIQITCLITSIFGMLLVELCPLHNNYIC
jgi:hypothetical protein